MKKRFDIQVLRGIAVLSVLFFHTNDGIFSNGYLGVDVFFVISGLVITPLVLNIFDQGNLRVALKTFYIRRFMRLAPAMGCTLGVSSVVIFLLGNLNDLIRFASQGIASLLVAGNFGALRFAGNYFSPNPNPLIHTWSLSVEEQIYIFLPFIMFLASFKGKSKPEGRWQKFYILLFSTSLIFYFIPLVISSLGFELAYIENHNFFYYFALSRLWEFIAGSLIYMYGQKRRVILSKNRRRVRDLSLILILLILLIPINLPTIITTPTIVFLASIFLLPRETVRSGRVFKLLGWIGDRSYSIYLVHMPLLYLAKYAPSLGTNMVREISIIMFFMSFVLGHLQYKFIETRYRLRSKTESVYDSIPLGKTSIKFIGTPLLLFILILVSASFNFKPFLTNYELKSTVDSHLLSQAGCVDKILNVSNCTWSVNQSRGMVMLVGDSQAYAAADGVQKAANALNLDFVGTAASGCPFLGASTTGSKPINCSEYQESVFRYIKSARPEIVIIANRTAGYLDPSSGWRTFINKVGNPSIDSSEASTIYSEDLSNTVNRLNDLGSKVIIFQDVPEPVTFLNSQSIYQHIFFREQYENGLTSKLKLDLIGRKIETNFERAGLVSLYDPSVSICGGSCLGEIDTHFNYMDSWHLSVTGSLALTPTIQDMLARKFVEPRKSVSK